MSKKSPAFRSFKSCTFIGIIYFFSAIVILAVISILYSLIKNGLNGIIYWQKLMAAILGTVEITFAASVVSVPLGIATAIYLAEYKGQKNFKSAVRFIIESMTSIPSIVAGLLVYIFFYAYFGFAEKAGFLGALALCVLMIPIIVKQSELALNTVTKEIREASLGLGAPKYKTILTIVLPTCKNALLTGVMLGVSRIIGETAALLITAGYAFNINLNLFSGQMSSLPIYSYNQFQTGFGIDKAWSSALILVILIIIINTFIKLITRRIAKIKKG